MSATHGDSYEDDGYVFDIVDFENLRLRVNVGPVFDHDDPHPEMAIWFEFNNNELLLMSQETFFAMVAHVHRRCDEWKGFAEKLDKVEQ